MKVLFGKIWFKTPLFMRLSWHFILFARTTFAWFTSKDEVTNRLTASNDYGVSIVESFVPPKNWVPGQEINKDVYAVNTGNIDAFVKESISGNLTYSYEKRTNVAPTQVDPNATATEQEKQAAALAKYVKLNAGDVRAIDGATTMEAGGFLAWTDATKTIYKIGGKEAELITEGTLANGQIKKDSKTVTDENSTSQTFAYQYMVGGDTYVGNELKEGAVFYKVGTGNTIDTTAADNLTMTVDYNPTAGEVNSATLTDVAQSTGENPIDNPGQVKGERWHPTETGAYVYRRSFVPAKEGYDPDFETKNPSATDAQKAENAAKAPYYTYAGYYYLANEDPTKEGDYYKIVLGNDDFRTYKETGADGKEREVFDVNAKESAMGSGTTILIDPATGRITDGSVAYTFVQEEKFENVKPMLTYHNKHEDKGVAYLQAYYAAGDTAESADFLAKQAAADKAEKDAEKAYQDYLDKLGQQGLAEAEFDNAVGAYNSAVSRYNQAEADWTYAKELSKASRDLIDAADTRGQAQKAYDDADDALNAAYAAVKKIAQDMRGGTDDAATVAAAPNTTNLTTNFSDLLLFGDGTDISYTKIFKTNLSGSTGQLEALIIEAITTLPAGTVSNASVLTDLEAYRSGMETLWGAANSTDDKTIVGATKRLDNALKAFQAANFDLNSPTGADADAKAKLQELKDARKNLETLLKNYKALFTNIKGVARSEAALTEINEGVADTNFENEIDAWIQRLADMETGINQCTTESKVGKLTIGSDGTINEGTDKYGIDAIVRDFVIKYNNFVKEKTDKLPKAEAAWEQALRQYNTDTTAAKTKYDGKIQKDQRVEDPFKSTAGSPVYEKNDYEGLTTDGTTPATTSANELWLTDNSKKIVGVYSVERPSDSSDPTLSSAFNGDGTVGGTGTIKSDAAGKDLWKTIGSNDTMPSGADNGEGNWNYYATNGTTTKEAAYATATNAYTKAIVADAKTNAAQFNTLVPNGTTYASVQTLADAIKADGALAKAKAAKTEAYDAARTTTTDAKTASDRANVVSQGATAAANAAQDADASAIKINIYLDDENDLLDWTSALADGESAQVADFYYNYILGAGQTSEKLIDSVELDSSVTSKDYKNLVFDLNVALDSRQVTYADDQRTITTEALAGDFGKTATVGRESTSGKGVEVTWSEGDHNLPNTIYRVGTTPVDAPVTTEVSWTNSSGATPVTYKYTKKITVNGVDYYGESAENGTTYFRLLDVDENAKAFTGFDTTAPATVVLNTVE